MQTTGAHFVERNHNSRDSLRIIRYNVIQRDFRSTISVDSFGKVMGKRDNWVICSNKSRLYPQRIVKPLKRFIELMLGGGG